MVQAELKGQELSQSLLGDGTDRSSDTSKQSERPAPGGPDLDTMVIQCLFVRARFVSSQNRFKL